jgi:CRISPR-associated protein Csb2
MTRRAAIQAMKDEEPGAWVNSFVAGHRTGKKGEHKQFSYIPLASIGHEQADAMIRRVMIAAPFGEDARLRQLAEHLDGVQLEVEGGGEGPVLHRLRDDGVVRRYLGPSKEWASVTPVILPGHDDHKPAKTVKLVEKALDQSGIEQACEFRWGVMPHFKNCLTAHKRGEGGNGYFRPDHLEALTAVHVRLTFQHEVRGPLFIGAGRHCGFGVMAVWGE